jgi:hypothetical protein
VADFCKHNDEPSGFINARNFLTAQLLIEECIIKLVKYLDS